MNLTITTYLAYLAIAVPLTIWVARALQRHGKRFLLDVFNGDDGLATAVNQLLVIGFYLCNLGFVALALRSDSAPADATAAFETLSRKVGRVALVVGLVHLFNVYVLNGFRRRALQRLQPAPTPAAAPWTQARP